MDPYIKVIDDPVQHAKGVDPQLEKGIQEVMKLFDKNPHVNPKHPTYEKR